MMEFKKFQFREIRIKYKIIHLHFSQFKKKIVNFQLEIAEYSDTLSRNSESCNRKNFTF